MKTESTSVGEPIWTSNVELLAQECLPVIGSCQVSSILHNLNTNNQETSTQNVDLIIIPANDLKLQNVDTSCNPHNNYVILKENGGNTNNDQIKNINERNGAKRDKSKKDNFEDMLYFVCNLCPFLCTKDEKNYRTSRKCS
ncbi:hypothetical protein NQ315_006715 [Exocentrus adspersus]|uniref:Uncharacterized protein n=1 Tax=Exocentrus adspersus TaxID=1586481 RepID=A0AAV8WBS1_9CUCU|nr:hypothetical protein NQ315_006715 [Exocentrus adspersus]